MKIEILFNKITSFENHANEKDFKHLFGKEGKHLWQMFIMEDYNLIKLWDKMSNHNKKLLENSFEKELF